MTNLTKVKTVLALFCLAAVAGSQLYFKGMRDAIEDEKQQAFNEYVAFAKPFQAEVKRMKHEAKADDVFARAGF